MRNETARRILHETPIRLKLTIFREALEQVKPETTEKIQKYTDMIDEEGNN